MKGKRYTIAAVLIATIFWFFDSLVHYFLYGESQFEFIPDDFNELWMRLIIVILLLILGIYADLSARRLIIKEKQLEAARVYKSMVQASRHILNNLLNQTQIIKIEALRCSDFDKEFVKHFDSAFDEAKFLIEKLSEVEDLSGENIWASVDPDNIARSADNKDSAVNQSREEDLKS